MAKRAKKAAPAPVAPVIHRCEGCGMQMSSPPELMPALCPGCEAKQGATNEQGSEEAETAGSQAT